MKLNRTPNELDRNARNGENDNWDKIEGAVGKIKGVVDDFVGEVSEEAFNQIVDNAKLNWKEPVDSYNDLPTDAENGDTRMVRNGQGGLPEVYRYDGNKWVKIQEFDTAAINELDNRLKIQLNDIDKSKPNASFKSVEYHVSPDGDDVNDGSADKPFKTLSKVVSMLPDMIRQDHTYTINLEEGVWEEELKLEHKVIFGSLIVQGTTTDREKHKVYRVVGESLLGHTEIRNITTTVKNASGQSFRFRRCTPYVYVDNVKAESDPTLEYEANGVIGLLADYGSQVFVENSDFGGKRYGMRCNYLSRIFSRDNTGEGNKTGMGARWSGILTLFGTQPKGSRKDTSTESGGIISQNYGGRIGVTDELGLTGGEMHQDTPYLKKRHIINEARLGLSGGISRGKQIRMRYKLVQTGYTIFRITYGAETSSSSGQYIECTFSGVLKNSQYMPFKKEIINSHNMAEDSIDIIHTGDNGEVDIIIKPLQALEGRWAIHSDSTLMRNYESPVLVSALIEDRVE